MMKLYPFEPWKRRSGYFISDGYNEGINSYIRKSADFNQFIEAVHQLGLYGLVLNENPPSQK